MTTPTSIQVPPGLVVITTYGSIRHETLAAILESHAR